MDFDVDIEFAIELFEERDHAGLENIDGVVGLVVGDSFKLHLEGHFAENTEEDEILEVVADSPLVSAEKLRFISLVVGDDTWVVFDLGSRFVDLEFRTI